MLSDLRSSLSPLEIIDQDDNPGLTVSVETNGSHGVVHVSGELDISTRRILFDACLGDGRTSMVIDMAEVDFMDCGGYGGIVAAGLVLQERGGSLTLRNHTGQPAHLLGLLSPTGIPADPTAEIAVPGNQGRTRLPQPDSRATADYRYRLIDDSDSPSSPGSVAPSEDHRPRPRTTEPPRRNGATRQVCTVRHPVDRI